MNEISRRVTSSSAIHDKLSHPVIDADAHIMECEGLFPDYVKAVGGREMAEELITRMRRSEVRGMFWATASGPYTLDRASVMLPKLMYQRLGEAGIDFALVYTTLGLPVFGMQEADMRRALARALNEMYADLYQGLDDGLRPVAVIPLHTPEEGIAELEYCVNELGYKAISIPAEIRRPASEISDSLATTFGPDASLITSLTIDSPYDYDPFWQKCLDLKVAPTCHSSSRGSHRHASPTNFVYNRLGDFAVSAEHLCRSLFLGGVTRRFPGLNFGFMEGGVGWACQLYNDLFEFWEKRNVKALRGHMNPRDLDMELMVEMFDKYGGGKVDGNYIRNNPDLWSSKLDEDENHLDDFAALDIEEERDIVDLFVPNFYFGCESDDRMNVTAFNAKMNHFDQKLNAVYSSDIGHWDVIDMTKCLSYAYGMVEKELMSEQDFEDFTFRNPALLHAEVNPDFFTGTRVESAVTKLLAGS